jgi:multiple sugar transport system ATP-binding protein
MSSVSVQKLSKAFGSTQVLRDIDLDVRDGEFVVFVGPSGCGKSTLLRLICGLDEVSAGTIAIDGEVVNDVPPARRGIAMVFQTYALYPHMSVAQNMGYALRLAGTDRAEIDRRVQAAASVLRLDALLARKPRELSGGQRQRVAIGRAIVREPRLFLFDEPLSNLDAALRVDMRAEIGSLKERLGTTMIYVTHDQVEAMTLADTIVVMNAGRIEQVGSPLEVYRAPANRFVATFIGSPRMNLVGARAGEDGAVVLGNGAVLPLRVTQAGGGDLTVGVRAEHLVLHASPAGAFLRGEARLVENLGSDVFVHVAVPGVDGTVIARQHEAAEVRVGAPVGLDFDVAHAHVFGSDGRRVAASAGRSAA